MNILRAERHQIKVLLNSILSKLEPSQSGRKLGKYEYTYVSSFEWASLKIFFDKTDITGDLIETIYTDIVATITNQGGRIWAEEITHMSYNSLGQKYEFVFDENYYIASDNKELGVKWNLNDGSFMEAFDLLPVKNNEELKAKMERRSLKVLDDHILFNGHVIPKQIDLVKSLNHIINIENGLSEFVTCVSNLPKGEENE
jgi:hypothetical protein